MGPFPCAPLPDTMSYLDMLLTGLKRPDVLIPEIAGFAYLAFFARTRRRQICKDIQSRV